MMRWCLVVLSMLVACGPRQETPSPEADRDGPAQASTRPLRVRVLEAVPGLEAVILAFGEEHGVPVVLEVGEPSTAAPAEPATLAEVRVADLGWLAPSQRLRPWSGPSDTVVASLREAGVWDGEALGVPWRMAASVPLADPGLVSGGGPEDWPALGRLLRARGWVLGSGGQALDLFTALHASAGGSFVDPDGNVTLDGPTAVEALHLTTGWAEVATRGAPDAWKSSLGVALVGLGDTRRLTDAVPFGLPGPDATDPPTLHLPVRPTLWVQPVGGVHRDLAAPLLERLLDREVQGLLAAGPWLPASTAWEPEGARADRLRGLRDGAVWLPAMSGGNRPHQLLAHAVDQALTRKRSPQDALRDAQQALLTEPQH